MRAPELRRGAGDGRTAGFWLFGAASCTLFMGGVLGMRAQILAWINAFSSEAARVFSTSPGTHPFTLKILRNYRQICT